MQHNFFHEINCMYERQDFASMHLFILPSLWQAIRKPRCALASQYVFLQTSPSSLNFLVLTFFCFESNLNLASFFFKWEINNLWSMLWHIWHKILKQKDRGLCGLCRKTHQQWFQRTHHRWRSLSDWFGGYTSALASCYNSQLLLLRSRLRGREITTLHCHHNSPAVHTDLCVTALMGFKIPLRL